MIQSGQLKNIFQLIIQASSCSFICLSRWRILSVFSASSLTRFWKKNIIFTSMQCEIIFWWQDHKPDRIQTKWGCQASEHWQGRGPNPISPREIAATWIQTAEHTPVSQIKDNLHNQPCFVQKSTSQPKSLPTHKVQAILKWAIRKKKDRNKLVQDCCYAARGVPEGSDTRQRLGRFDAVAIAEVDSVSMEGPTISDQPIKYNCKYTQFNLR